MARGPSPWASRRPKWSAPREVPCEKKRVVRPAAAGRAGPGLADAGGGAGPGGAEGQRPGGGGARLQEGLGGGAPGAGEDEGAVRKAELQLHVLQAPVQREAGSGREDGHRGEAAQRQQRVAAP